MVYEVAHDQVTGWQPCCVRARVTPGAGPGPPLREHFEVTDCAGGSWLRAGKLQVQNRHLLDRTSVTFSVTPLPALTSEDLLQCQGQYQLQVTCFLDLPSGLPGMGVAAPLDIPVAGLCQIQLALPVEVETSVERLNDDESVLVQARPHFLLQTGAQARKEALDSLSFECSSPDLKLEHQPPRGDWKVVKVTYQPGQTSAVSELTLRIQGQSGYQPIPEKKLLLPFALEGRLALECLPQSLKLDGQNSVTVYASPLFRNPATPLQLRSVLESLQLSFDPTCTPWLLAGPRLLSEDRASWRIDGRPCNGLLPPGARLTVCARFGSEIVQESVALALEPDTQMELFASGAGEVFFDKQKGWVFEDLQLSLARPGQAEPVPLNISCNPPTLGDDQNLLLFEVQQSGPGRWTVRPRLRPEVDLDARPGTDWLENSGRLNISARVEQSGGQGKIFQTTASYQLRPRLELMVFDAASKPDSPEGHTYEAAGIAFDPLEFAADGVDRLRLSRLVVRTDQSPEDWPRQDYSRYLHWQKPRLVGPGADEFRCQPISAEEMEVQALQACLLTAARSGRRQLTLQLAGQLKPEAPANLFREAFKLESALHPRYVDLKLWVIPSRKRGRSLAAAWAGLNRHGQSRPDPLPAAEVELQVVSPESLLGLSEAANKNLDSQGWQTWELAFSGLNRTNLGTTIKVRCRLGGAQEGVCFSINVKANGAQLFSALNQASGSLELTNPEWEQGDSAASWVDWLIPDRCRGVVYNARNLLAPAFLEGPVPSEWSRWVCGAYSERITDWLLARRHGKQEPAQALSMNGLEVCQYTAAGFHDWCGIHLSGTDVNADPVFIDPWWEQSWGEDAAGYGWAQQEIRMVASLTFLVVEWAPLASHILRSLARPAIKLADWVARKVLPEVLFAIKQKVSAWVAGLVSGQASRPNTVRAVVSAATALGAYLYQKFCMGASCGRVTCFDDHFDYSYYDETSLLERLQTSGSPARLWEYESW